MERYSALLHITDAICRSVHDTSYLAPWQADNLANGRRNNHIAELAQVGCACVPHPGSAISTQPPDLPASFPANRGRDNRYP